MRLEAAIIFAFRTGHKEKLPLTIAVRPMRKNFLTISCLIKSNSKAVNYCLKETAIYSFVKIEGVILQFTVFQYT